VAKGESKPNTRARDHGGGSNNNNRKMKAGGNQPLARAPTTTAASAGGGHGRPKGNKRPCQPSNSDDGGMKCLVHNSTRHSMSKCREINKLIEQFHQKMH
jgi:hypothetical protein